MNKIGLLITVLVIFVTSCDIKKSDKIQNSSTAEITQKKKMLTTVQIIDSVIDIGEKPNQPQTVFFRFKNTGTNDLVLFEPHAGCGCTQPKLQKDIYAPGEEGKLEVTYNGKAPGTFEKTSDVKCNTDLGTLYFKIKGVIVEKK